MKRKYKVLIVLISIIISLISYFFILDGYYSIDLERITDQGYFSYAIKDAYIRDGRLFLALIFLFVAFINPSLKILYIISLILAIIILSFAVLEIYKIMEHYKESKTKKDKIIKFIISYITIFTFTQIDAMQFVEAFALATSVLLFIISVKKTIIERKTKLGFIIALIGVFFYQGTISIYIVMSVLMCFLENKKFSKQFFKDLFKCALIIILVTILNLVTALILPELIGLEKTPRLLEDKIIVILNNMNYFKGFIFESVGLFPNYLWVCYILICLIIMSIYSVKTKKIDKYVNILFLIITSIISVFPYLIIQFGATGRILGAWGQMIGTLMVYMYCETGIFQEKNIYMKLLTITLITYFIINILNTIRVTKIYDMSNKLDIEFSNIIKSQVEEYKEKGEEIKSFSIWYVQDGRYREKYKNIKDITTSRYFLGIYNSQTLKYYTGIDLVKEYKEQIFYRANFDFYNDEEIQTKKIEDTLYILVNL